MLRIVQLNLAFDPRVATSDGLLDRYHTLTGWSRALASTGASVHTIQRFPHDEHVVRDGGEYQFVADGERAVLDEWEQPDRVVAAVVATAPDVVHVNGLMFPGAVAALRTALPAGTAIVLQDHSGSLPRTLPWPLDRLHAARWRQAFLSADACTFTSQGLAERWHRFGLPTELPIVEIPEASTTLRAIDRALARTRTGLTADCSVLWVGHLIAGKDPLTWLAAFERALPQLRGVHGWMIFSGGDLETQVRARIAESALREHVTLIGAVAHDRMAEYFSAADVFVSASRHEGSGYALIEALACGVAPCVTDIPASRALVGSIGRIWRAGDPDDGASAICDSADLSCRPSRDAVRAHFDATLDWRAIGQRTVQTYCTLVERRRAR